MSKKMVIIEKIESCYECEHFGLHGVYDKRKNRQRFCRLNSRKFTQIEMKLPLPDWCPLPEWEVSEC